MPFDIARTRAAYPALAEGFVHFDGAGGTQTRSRCDRRGHRRHAVGASATAAPPTCRAGGRWSWWPQARAAVADLVGADPAGVVFGPSATALTYTLARDARRGLAARATRSWSPGSTTTRTCGRGCRPPSAAGATVRWAEFDPATGELPAAAVRGPGRRADPVGRGDRRRATPSAPCRTCRRSPTIAHAAGALVYVDGVHATPHGPIDVAALGRRLLRHQRVQVVRAAPGGVRGRPGAVGGAAPGEAGAVPDAVPDRFEHGTLELRAAGRGGRRRSTTWRGWTRTRSGDRRARLRAGHGRRPGVREGALRTGCSMGWPHRPAMTVCRPPARRCPTVSFRVAGQPPGRTGRRRWAPPGSASPPATTTPTSTSSRWACATAAARSGPASTTTTRPTRWTDCSPNWTRWPSRRGEWPDEHPGRGQPGEAPLRDPGRQRARRLHRVPAARRGAGLHPHRGGPGFQNMGVGAALVRGTLDQVRERGQRVVPQCPFMAAFIERTPSTPTWSPTCRSASRQRVPASSSAAARPAARVAPWVARCTAAGDQLGHAQLDHDRVRAGGQRPVDRGPHPGVPVQVAHDQHQRAAAGPGGRVGRHVGLGAAGRVVVPGSRSASGAPTPHGVSGADGDVARRRELDHVRGRGQRQRGRPGAAVTRTARRAAARPTGEPAAARGAGAGRRRGRPPSRRRAGRPARRPRRAAPRAARRRRRRRRWRRAGRGRSASSARSPPTQIASAPAARARTAAPARPYRSATARISTRVGDHHARRSPARSRSRPARMRPAQGRRQVRVERGHQQVPGHHRLHAGGDGGPERDQLARRRAGPGRPSIRGRSWCESTRVSPWPGEVLGAGGDAGAPAGRVTQAAVCRATSAGSAPKDADADDRVVRVGVDVGVRGVVEGDARGGQLGAEVAGDLLGQRRVVDRAEGEVAGPGAAVHATRSG